MDSNLALYFWHGVGRAMYFSPDSFLPVRNLGWSNLNSARSLPPSRIARVNAVAGLAWAVTLVDLQRPRIIEVFVQGCSGQEWEVQAMANGVTSAATVWLDYSGQPAEVEKLCVHQPAGRFQRPAIWDDVVRQPCTNLLNGPTTDFAQRGQVDQIFQYQEPSVYDE
jgi:hypothetical protein